MATDLARCEDSLCSLIGEYAASNRGFAFGGEVFLFLP